MDTKWKKWINTLCITIVIIVMSAAAIEGVNVSNRFANVMDSVSYDTSFEESDVMADVMEKVIIDWAKDQGIIDKEAYYHTDDIKIPSGYKLKADLVIQPYGKKSKKSTTTYGDLESDKSAVNKVIDYKLQRNPSYNLRKNGQIERYAANPDGYDVSDFYLEVSQYSILDTMPQNFFINDQQRLESLKIRIEFSQNFMNTLKKEYKQDQKIVEKAIKEAIIIAGIEVLGTILLIILFALQKNRTRFFKALDRIWWEVIAMIAICGIGCIISIPMMIAEVSRQYVNGNTAGSSVEVAMMSSYMVMPVLIGLFAICVQTTVWRLKEHNFLDSTLCVGYFRKWYRNSKERQKLEYEAMSFAEQHAKDRIRQFQIARRILIAAVILLICSISALGFVGFGLVVLGVFAIRYLTKYSDRYAEEQRDLCKLVEQIEKISNGELSAVTDIAKESAYYDYSQKLTNIGSGMEKALEAQLKGERMKIDLITNVSHDLKTPLTSIIGYVDLLSRDETLSPEARDYVQILTKKTERLKNIIADLFELAKSTSGDIKINLEVMDMRRLIEQTLGDMEDQIKEAGFGIRFRCETENTQFLGDVNRMYRVVQNVLENALKYSLKGTRIFVNITEDADHIQLEVINTASYEMNFTEEEIMERFARAEKSRSSEGNGLGLSIADSFTKNCGGEFAVKIEGDQFKVTVKFQKITNKNIV
ncbi:sensor histidine kinase [Anaerostipes faecalis]|uniref:sensor histidine kinase n=1 Tax=Anaerostipes faecalis TaxID=2738446 RepID=UPI003F012CAD